MSAPERDHVHVNRQMWDRMAPDWVDAGRRAWARSEIDWGIFDVPEAEVGMLGDVDGCDAIELGCGTAYISAWLARRGARPVGLDSSAVQLATARTLQREFALTFPLVHASAEHVPFPASRFDLAISEYGACIWCDPYRWVPEAARVLRPGGRLVFLVNSMLLLLCMPEREDVAATNKLLRPLFDMRRFDWPGDQGVNFGISHGEWIRLLRGSGFEIEDLIELAAPPGATSGFPFVTAEWAGRWPAEEVWKARKVR